MTQKKYLIISTSILLLLITIIVGSFILTRTMFIKDMSVINDSIVHKTNVDSISIPFKFNVCEPKKKADSMIHVITHDRIHDQIHDSSTITTRKKFKQRNRMVVLDTTDTITIMNKYGEVLFKGTFNDRPLEHSIVVDPSYNKPIDPYRECTPDTSLFNIEVR